MFDLISLILLYALGARLYSRKVGLLAALLGAFTVLLIQHAHFFVVDPFANTFVIAGLYLAVRAQDEGGLLDYGLFGVAVGAAAASKISALPLAGIILVAVAARVIQADRTRREEVTLAALWGVLLAGVSAFVTFRVLQPYAFEGPAIWNILPNREWLADLAEVRVQSSGLADLPFALQWADRPPVLFALGNLLYWGMGLPLGLAAWASWGAAVVQAVRGRWQRHLIPIVWTGAFFLWQSTAFTPAMRYMLPVYPTLIILAAWGSSPVGLGPQPASADPLVGDPRVRRSWRSPAGGAPGLWHRFQPDVHRRCHPRRRQSVDLPSLSVGDQSDVEPRGRVVPLSAAHNARLRFGTRGGLRSRLASPGRRTARFGVHPAANPAGRHRDSGGRANGGSRLFRPHAYERDAGDPG
jgi:hypothetical protein